MCKLQIVKMPALAKLCAEGINADQSSEVASDNRPGKEIPGDVDVSVL